MGAAMSTAASKWAWDTDAGNTRNKLVLLALADFVGKDGNQCWPRIKTLAAKTGLNEKTVRLALDDLAKRKLISRQAQFLDGTQYRRSDLFTLNLSAAAHPGEAPAYPGDTPASPGNTPDDIRASRPVHPGNTPAPIEPVLNRNVEPKKERGTRLPLDWQPTSDNLAYAKKHGLGGEELRDEIESFRCYWHGVPGSRGMKLDWDKTWINSVLRWKGRNRNRRPTQRNGHDNIAGAFVDALIAEDDRLSDRGNVIDVDFAAVGGR